MAFGAGHRRKNGNSHYKHSNSFQPSKIIYKMYQAKHHLTILRKAENDDNHPLFMRKVNELDSYFKVAGARDDPEYLAKLRQGNREWRTFHIRTQIEHYVQMIDFEKGALAASNLSKSEIVNSLNTAKSWARKNYKKKFIDSEFYQVEQIANRYASEPKKADLVSKAKPAKIVVASTPLASRKRRASTPDHTGKRVNDSSSPQSDSPKNLTVPAIAKSVTPNKTWVTPRNSRKRVAESSPEISPNSTNLRDSKKSNLSESPNSTTSSPSQNDSDLDFGFGSRFRVLENNPDVASSSDDNQDVATPSDNKRKKDDNSSPTSPKITPKRGRRNDLISNESSPQLHQAQLPISNEDSPQPHPSQLPPKRIAEFNYTRPSNKIQFRTSGKVQWFKSLNNVRGKEIVNVWEIPKISKPNVIIGTSNFRRVENVDRDDVQIISYSGLKFDHLNKLLEGFKYGKKSKRPGMQPAHLTIMAGINDMNLQFRTLKSSVSRTYFAAKRQFPDSKISFCLVPMNKPKFTLKQCQTIDGLNKEIESFCKSHKIKCIPKISNFEVDPADPIHWTPTCADNTINHILGHLN